MKNTYLTILLIFSLFLNGCMTLTSHTPSPVVPDSVVNQEAEKIPIDVAIYFPSGFNEKVINIKPQMNVGKSSIRLFKEGLSKVFRSIIEINKRPSSQEEYDLVLVPQISGYSKGTNLNFSLTIEYTIDAFTPTDKFTWKGTGHGREIDIYNKLLSYSAALFPVLFPVAMLDTFTFRYVYVQTPSTAISKAETSAFEELVHQIQEDHNLDRYVREANKRRTNPSELILTASYHDRGSILPSYIFDTLGDGAIISDIEGQKYSQPGFDSNKELIRLILQDPKSEEKWSDLFASDEPEELNIPVSGALDIGSGDDSITTLSMDRAVYDSNKIRSWVRIASLMPDNETAHSKPSSGETGMRDYTPYNRDSELEGLTGVTPQNDSIEIKPGLPVPLLGYTKRILDNGAEGTEGNGNGIIENGETVRLYLTATNKGLLAARDVRLNLNTEEAGIMGSSADMEIGDISPGGKGRPVSILLPIDHSYSSPILPLKIIMTQSDYANIDETINLPVDVTFPLLVSRHIIHDGDSITSTGNRNGIIETGEKIELEIYIKNIGKRCAMGVTISIASNKKGITILNNEAIGPVGNIHPGTEIGPFKLEFLVQHSAEPGPVPIDLGYSQNNFKDKKQRIVLNLAKEGESKTASFAEEPIITLNPSESGDAEMLLLQTTVNETEDLLKEKDLELKALKSRIAEMKETEKEISVQTKKQDNRTTGLEVESSDDSLMNVLTKWLDAWERKDLETNLSFYSPDFKRNGKDLDQLRAYKKVLYNRYEWIAVEPENINITVKGEAGKISYVQKFHGESYKKFPGKSYSDYGIKNLTLKKEGKNWRIVNESWRPVYTQTAKSSSPVTNSIEEEKGEKEISMNCINIVDTCSDRATVHQKETVNGLLRNSEINNFPKNAQDSSLISNFSYIKIVILNT